jgi:hypothetical protein
MTNRNFEDIDQLFREGLNPEKDQFTSVDTDWAKLKDRLDRNETKKRGIFWLIRLSGVAALILLFFAIRMLLPDQQNQIVQQNEVKPADQKIKVEEYNKNVPPKNQIQVNKSEPDFVRTYAQNKNAGKQSETIQRTKLSPEKSTQDSVANPTANSNINQSNVGQATENKSLNTSTPETAKLNVPEKPADDGKLFAANEKPNAVAVAEPEFRKLAVSFLAAPDYNGVNNLNNALIGNDFGLILSYKFAKNWRLSSGAVYGKKLYETGFNNYNPTRDIWTEYYPESISADCRVLDIPLNVSYSFLNRKNTSLSLGTGISSYIMLREDYSFTYTEKDDDTALSYHVANENQHWLKVINLELTLEQRLNPNFSLGIQPFMKIPMSNIGFAGVKLQSVGLAVILSYNLNL